MTIYLNEEKVEIQKIVNGENDKDAEYKYIDIINLIMKNL